MVTERHLSAEQLAARYGVKLRTIWTWKQRGYGPRPRKFRNRLYYVEADVAAWEAEHQHEVA